MRRLSRRRESGWASQGVCSTESQKRRSEGVQPRGPVHDSIGRKQPNQKPTKTPMSSHIPAPSQPFPHLLTYYYQRPLIHSIQRQCAPSLAALTTPRSTGAYPKVGPSAIYPRDLRAGAVGEASKPQSLSVRSASDRCWALRVAHFKRHRGGEA